MTPGPGIEPGTHWWKASALTTAPTLLPSHSGFRYFSSQSAGWNTDPSWTGSVRVKHFRQTFAQEYRVVPTPAGLRGCKYSKLIEKELILVEHFCSRSQLIDQINGVLGEPYFFCFKNNKQTTSITVRGWHKRNDLHFFRIIVGFSLESVFL